MGPRQNFVLLYLCLTKTLFFPYLKPYKNFVFVSSFYKKCHSKEGQGFMTKFLLIGAKGYHTHFHPREVKGDNLGNPSLHKHAFGLPHGLLFLRRKDTKQQPRKETCSYLLFLHNKGYTKQPSRVLLAPLTGFLRLRREKRKKLVFVCFPFLLRVLFVSFPHPQKNAHQKKRKGGQRTGHDP